MIKKTIPLKLLKNTTLRRSLLALALCLLLSTLSLIPVQAQPGLTVLDSSVQAEFPLSFTFSLSTRSDVDISDIRLHYVVDREGFAQVTSEVYIEFVPDITVDTEWTWDMRKTGGLPPGAGVDYWWTVEDASGDQVETTPVRVYFEDLRYAWHNLTEDKVTLYWYEGEEPFAQELMTAAQQALARLAEDTGAHLEKLVKIYIYADSQDLQGALVFPQEWTGGVAFTRYGTTAIGIAPTNLEWGKRTVAHELAHLVVHQMTFNPYGGLPTWLDEGLAMYAEGKLGVQFQAYLDTMIAEDSLISVRSLSSPFSAYAGESILAYAQSYSLIEFLVTNYGHDKILELLNVLRQGNNYDTALETVYGFDADGLNSLWRAYITEQEPAVESPTAAIPQALAITATAK